jgi:hypothetical protein
MYRQVFYKENSMKPRKKQKPQNVKLIGQKFGKLTVISKGKSIDGGITVKRKWGTWNCQCDCGALKIVKTIDLNGGNVRSCGCLIGQYGVALNPGQKFGRLTTISYKKGRWFCLCECGDHTEVKTENLTSQNTRSCGCLNREIASQKSDKLIAGRRKYEPKIASARRRWQSYLYSDSQCVSFDEFMIISQQNCVYCGIGPSTNFNCGNANNSSIKKKAEGEFIYNGMDRIDSSRHHTIDNVVPCCYDCNRAKNNRTVKNFLEWVKTLKTIAFYPMTIIDLPFPTHYSLKTSIKCIFRNHKDETDMTMEEYYSISQLNCFYCDNPPLNLFNRAKSDKKASKEAKLNGGYSYNGIDRVDRNFAHNKDNVVASCHWCNFAKSKLTLAQFYEWIERIQLHQARLSLLHILEQRAE